MKIGTANGFAVNWDKNDKVIRIYGTSIMITGAVDKEKAIELCKRNLTNFKEA